MAGHLGQPLQPDPSTNADRPLQHRADLVPGLGWQVQGHIPQHLSRGLLIPGADRGVKGEERPEVEGHGAALRFLSLPVCVGNRSGLQWASRGVFLVLRRDRCTSPAPPYHHHQPTMPEPDFRAALQQLADAIDGWQMAYGLKADDPLYIAMNHARELLRTPERLSSGKLVSERIEELVTEVAQRDLSPAEIILGSRAFELYCKEMRRSAREGRLRSDNWYGLPVTKSDSEAAEYVGIECQQ